MSAATDEVNGTSNKPYTPMPNRRHPPFFGVILCVMLGALYNPAQAQNAFNWADHYGKSPTQFTPDDWRAIIDATWGDGLPTPQKLLLFDRWWNEINQAYGAFHNVDLDIVALRDAYRPEVEAGVSRGRFAALMSHLTYQLQELHTGGGALGVDGFTLLFNDIVPTVGYDRRIRGADFFAMEPDPGRSESLLVIRGRADTYYDKPIAVLIGPGSISAGELEALRLSFHPGARLFGKTAPGGNTGSDFINLGNSDWLASLSTGSMYLVSTHQYLAHVGLEPDEPVWFTREDVARGIDTVVEAALAWIEGETQAGAEDDGLCEGAARMQSQAFPNPFYDAATITFTLADASPVTVAIYNVLGQRIATLTAGMQPSGEQSVVWDGRILDGRKAPSGPYFYRIHAGASSATGALVYVR
jgi:hypothetical protein